MPRTCRLPALIGCAAVALTPAGCGLPLPPREIRPAGEGPWVAPGRQTPVMYKEYLALFDDGPGYWYWLGGDGGRRKTAEVTRGLEDYLDATGHLRRWPGPRRFLGSDWWTAPFDFTIVSLTPDVVLMTPAAHNPDNDEEFGRLYHRVGQDQYWRFGGVRKLVNGFYAEPRVRFSPGMKWFSDDLNQPPTDLTVGPDGVAQIALPDGRLVVARNGVTCLVTRE